MASLITAMDMFEQESEGCKRSISKASTQFTTSRQASKESCITEHSFSDTETEVTCSRVASKETVFTVESTSSPRSECSSSIVEAEEIACLAKRDPQTFSSFASPRFGPIDPTTELSDEKKCNNANESNVSGRGSSDNAIGIVEAENEHLDDTKPDVASRIGRFSTTAIKHSPTERPCVLSNMETKAMPVAIGDAQMFCRSDNLERCATKSAAHCSVEKATNSKNQISVLDNGPTIVEADLGRLHYEPSHSTKLISAITQSLMGLMKHGGTTQRLTCFHAIRAPRLSINEYLVRFSQYFQCSEPCFILGFVFMKRVLKWHPKFVLNEVSVHRFVLASMLVAVKFHDDSHFKDTYYSKVGGVSIKSLRQLESEFLHFIRWRLCVSLDEYDQARTLLQSEL